MSTHKSFESLRKAVLNKAKNGMEKQVMPLVRREMTKAIDEVVYDAYTPIDDVNRGYVRRKHSGGLLDDKNMVGRIETDYSNSRGFEYQVQNITMPKNNRSLFYLAPLIVMGQQKAKSVGYPVIYNERTEYLEYNEPRDFYAETTRIMRNSNIGQFLEDYMNGRGGLK
jgi:hypothetical protein